MKLRRAEINDLPQLQEIYRKLVQDLDSKGICIWDESYPMEFFRMDIAKNRLWMAERDGVPLGAFALCKSDPGAKFVRWSKPDEPALYMARLGVDLRLQGQGFGRELMKEALSVAREEGAAVLRLFVADCNRPAIKLYESLGYQKCEGIYELRIDENMILHEYGYEKETVD